MEGERMGTNRDRERREWSDMRARNLRAEDEANDAAGGPCARFGCAPATSGVCVRCQERAIK